MMRLVGCAGLGAVLGMPHYQFVAARLDSDEGLAGVGMTPLHVLMECFGFAVRCARTEWFW